jgi:polyhydroxyalkanoate synthesis repressor PhaR
VAEAGSPDGEPIIVKKYANRRLYNTETSTYVTLDDLAQMVRNEKDFVVYDAKSGDDLTHAVLTQIIVDQESRGQNLLPIGFLRQLIRFYGDSIGGIVPRYLEFSLNSLTRQQERYRKQFSSNFGAAAFDAMQEQARNNFAVFERALGMFTPFPPNGDATPKNGPAAPAPRALKEEGAPSPAGRSDQELETLKAELSAMQERLEKLSRR